MNKNVIPNFPRMIRIGKPKTIFRIVRPKCPNCLECPTKMWRTSQTIFKRCPNCMHFGLENVRPLCYIYLIEREKPNQTKVSWKD